MYANSFSFHKHINMQIVHFTLGASAFTQLLDYELWEWLAI